MEYKLNPKLISWDYGKELNVTLTDALISLESLRFMLGGAIKRPGVNGEKVVVRHTEEVVCGDNGVLPKPKDHLTGVTLTPTATADHPIRLINLTTGARTQLVATGADTITIDGLHAINFVNPSALAGETANTKVTAKGDHVRIFWETVIENDSGAETAIEVTISPDTLNLSGLRCIKIINCWKLLLDRTISSQGRYK